MTFLFTVLLLAPLAAQTAPARVPLLDQHDLQLAMARLAAEHPDLVTIRPVGESRGKRRIEALRMPAREPEPGRPAMLVVTNVEGPQAWTSGIALDHVRSLAERYATDARVKALLDTTTIYFIPRADPDAAEARFQSPLFEQRASGPGVDDDRDGRQGEDPPRDVDGDGMITWMRVPDPEGEWIVDPTDERALVEADRARGQRGRWKLVREGRDADRDEVASEDQELDTVLNRNFPAGWEEHAADAGRFATDEPGAKALCDFLVLHKEVALVVTYGMLDNVVEKPRVEGKAGRQSMLPSAGIPEDDVAVYAELGRRFAELGRGMKGDGRDAGTFQAWAQVQRGVWTIDIAPWRLPLDEAAAKKSGDAESETESKPDERAAGQSETERAGAEAQPGSDTKPAAKGDVKTDAKKGEAEPKPSDDAKRLRWIDAKGEATRFVSWHAFQHPELGAVEIGGFAPYALVEPPESEREEIARKNLDFLIALGESLARIELVDVTATDLGSGLWKLRAVLVNDGYLPYTTALGRRTRAIRPVRIALDLPKEAVVLAGERQTLVRELAGSGGRSEHTWLLRGAPPSAMRVILDTDHAGSASVVPEVK